MCAILCAACAEPQAEQRLVLTTVGQIQLAEDGPDVLAEVGAFSEVSDGGVLVADALQAKIRRYDADGREIAAFGGYGSGPFEFRRIGGVAEYAGKVLVTDPILGRTTLLSLELLPDTSYAQYPRPRGGVTPFRHGLLFATSAGDRATFLSYVIGSKAPEWSVPAPSPGPPSEYPYWGSIARTWFAAGREEWTMAYSLRYPIVIHDADGSRVDSITQPRSFRQASVPELGAFAGPGRDKDLARWLATFDVIANLSVLQDTLLVVTRGHMEGNPTSRFNIQHDRVDIYHLGRRQLLAVDIPLPENARVLAGGEYLYVLVGEPPAPWTIARLTITREGRDTGREREAS